MDALRGGVAHDFNNMLTVIMGQAELARRLASSDSKIAGAIDEIRNAAERSADLTRQLLVFARKQIITPRHLDLNETVEGMLKMLRRLIGESIQVIWNPDRRPCFVMIDPVQIDQLVANLCVNARDAIEGAGSITICTRRRIVREDDAPPGADPGTYCLLGVRDTGHGMDPEIREHIFEPFFTTKGLHEGTGLGLATVFGIVHQNGGFVEVDSEPDRGSEFRIFLPEKDPPLNEESDDEPFEDEAPGGLEAVFLVEDEPAILDICSLLLESAGYAVAKAEDPEEAITRFRESGARPDLLITDVIMPNMNGSELAEVLRKDHPELRCLFMSGYNNDVIAREGFLPEDVDFIQKPFSSDDFLNSVRRVLDRPAPS